MGPSRLLRAGGLLAAVLLPLRAEADTPADPARALAQRIFEAANGPALRRLEEISFTFVVESEGKRTMEVRHRWRVREGTDAITWIGKDGKKYDGVVTLATRRATGTIDGRAASGPELDALSESAYARFINDTYWLLMPIKLLDPGVVLEALPDKAEGDKKLARIRLSFKGVGLTPGDVYELDVDPAGPKVIAWHMKLQGQKDPPSRVTWEDYRQVGPLILSHLHVFESGRRIRFEETAAR